MLAFITKLLKWLPIGGAGVVGIIQAVVKFIKEVLTLIVNILFPIIPSAQFKLVVQKVRDIVNAIDAWLESKKSILLGILG